MVALHHALEDNDTEGIQRIANMHKISRNSGKNLRFEKGMLQQIKGESSPVIWYCYWLVQRRNDDASDTIGINSIETWIFLVFCLFLCHHLRSLLAALQHSASGAENDLNYLEIPMDLENSVNAIDGRLSPDEAVGVEFWNQFHWPSNFSRKVKKSSVTASTPTDKHAK